VTGGVRYLDLGDLLVIAEAVTGISAEVLASMPRVVDLTSSALAVPSASWDGHEAYPRFAQKVGLQLARLAKNHALPDGNKRVAFLAMIEFIERNDHLINLPQADDVVQLVVDVSVGVLPEAELVEWLGSRLRPVDRLPEELVAARPTCEICEGTGKLPWGADCSRCNGAGYLVVANVDRLRLEMAARGWTSVALADEMTMQEFLGSDWRRYFNPPDISATAALEWFLSDEARRLIWEPLEAERR
jgi:death-on-curing protein